jgi:type VI secretion system secreted protein Hcp
MAVDVFLKIDGIAGESKDHKHKDEIDVLSWSWGASQSGTMAFGGGGGAGKVNFQDISVMKRFDKSSPNLWQSCASGKHIAKATLYCRKAGEKQQEYLTITFTDLLVSSVQVSASSEEPTESLSLNFSKAEMEYKPQDAKGTLLGGVKFGWDLKKNEKV